jgi:MFS transporter, putative metabolite:H+ symporter
VTPFAVVALFTEFGVTGVVTAVAALLVLQAIVVALLGVETRKRPLEELRPDAMAAGTQSRNLQASPAVEQG